MLRRSWPTSCCMRRAGGLLLVCMYITCSVAQRRPSEPKSSGRSLL